MANICTNYFYFRSDQHKDMFIDFFDNLCKIDFLYTNSVNEDGISIEGNFDSKWVFPKHIFEGIFTKDCYFRCLSEEYGNGYVAMNIYKDGTWLEEQTFYLI